MRQAFQSSAHRFAALIWAVSLAGPCTVSAYQEIGVTNGGTVTGSVTFVGEVPAPTGFELWRYPDRVYCGALSDGSGYRFLQPVSVGAQRGLKDVVVTIEGVERGKPFPWQETHLEANMCQFVPFVSVVRDHHPLIVNNLDAVSHDLQFYERGQEHIFMMFHRPALTKLGTSDTVRFTANRRSVTMQCGFHPYMQGHGLGVDNPYYAVTGLEGTFSIPDLPPGTYRIKAWHPTLGEQERTVTVAEKGTTAAEFSFGAR